MPKSNTGTKSKKSTKTEQTTTELVETVAPVSLVPSETLASVSSEVQLSSSEPVVEQTNENTNGVEESSTEILFNKLLNQFQDIQNVMKTLHSNLKVLQKEVLRERKESKKKESKKKKSSVKKQLSGFAKASPISSVLADFLNISHDHQIARTEVTSKVIAYIKAENLQNPANKKQIIPDAKLGAVLQSGDDVVTFFNLQTYLKKHFVSNTVVEQPTVV